MRKIDGVSTIRLKNRSWRVESCREQARPEDRQQQPGADGDRRMTPLKPEAGTAGQTHDQISGRNGGEGHTANRYRRTERHGQGGADSDRVKPERI